MTLLELEPTVDDLVDDAVFDDDTDTNVMLHMQIAKSTIITRAHVVVTMTMTGDLL